MKFFQQYKVKIKKKCNFKILKNNKFFKFCFFLYDIIKFNNNSKQIFNKFKY